MKSRFLILPLFVAGTLSSIYFLPSAGTTAQSAVQMDLPDGYGAWHFEKYPPSEKEIKTLAPDTEFAKAVCTSPRPGEFDEIGRQLPDRIDLSVVLSGVDINNSIHRPERCMPAQGHQILSSSDKTVTLADGKSLTVKRLLSVQRLPTASEEGSDHLEFKCVTYYFFVGHDTITNDHMERTFIDMKDRLIKGMDQRWAYVSVSMWYGEMPPEHWLAGTVIPEEEADRKLTDFVTNFSKNQIDWDQVKP